MQSVAGRNCWGKFSDRDCGLDATGGLDSGKSIDRCFVIVSESRSVHNLGTSS